MSREVIVLDTEVVIDKEYYESLKEDANWVRALEAAGVDNWVGIDYAQELLG